MKRKKNKEVGRGRDGIKKKILKERDKEGDRGGNIKKVKKLLFKNIMGCKIHKL